MADKWEIEQNTPNGDYVLHKEFANGPDVFIAVNRVEGGYEVRISVASPAGEGNDSVKGPVKTFDAALALAKAESKNWDEKQKRG